MKTFLKSIDERVWNSIKYRWEKPTTPVSEWQTSQKEAAAFNKKVMNAIFNTVSMEEFKRIFNVKVAHTAWISSRLCMRAQRQLKSTNCSS